MTDAVELPTSSEIVFYQGEDGRSRIQVRLDGGTVWLTQVLLADLYQTTKQNISLHIKNIFEEEELSPASTVKQYLTVQVEGKREVRRAIDHYNLDVILAVGYRVRSPRGTQCRRWATEKRFDQKIRDLYALAVDYATSETFFVTPVACRLPSLSGSP